VRPQERARPGVAGRHADHLRPVRGGDEHRVARLAVVGGDRDRSASVVGGDQAPDRLRPDERLISQGNHGRGCVGLRAAGLRGAGSCGAAQGMQTGHERRAHPGQPVRIMHGERVGQLDRHCPGHHEHRVRAAVAQQSHATLGEGSAC
jgi:hypothetical protein